MNARGVVLKLDLEHLRSLWLMRDDQVLLGDPWGWSEQKRLAHVFETYELAQEVARKYREAGHHAHAAVFGRDMEVERAPASHHSPARNPEAEREERRRRHQEILERMHIE